MTENTPAMDHTSTNWHVITGAPCSGKTSVINGLARRGFKVVHEAARAYIDRQLASGYSLNQIKSDILQFERHILYEKVRIEKSLVPGQTVFLDRAVPDSVAYFQIEGLDWREPLKQSQGVSYGKIFLFDQLAFEKDAVRSEDQALAGHIETLLEKCYRDFGYPIIRVPVKPIDRRIDFILSQI